MHGTCAVSGNGQCSYFVNVCVKDTVRSQLANSTQEEHLVDTSELTYDELQDAVVGEPSDGDKVPPANMISAVRLRSCVVVSNTPTGTYLATALSSEMLAILSRLCVKLPSSICKLKMVRDPSLSPDVSRLMCGELKPRRDVMF